MKISAKQMPAMYDWLRSASKALSVAPPSDRVAFRMSPVKRFYGQCRLHPSNMRSGQGKVATIYLTELNQDIHQFVETMAHEMCHIVQYADDVAARGALRSAHHGPKFQRLGRKVCQELRLNPHTF